MSHDGNEHRENPASLTERRSELTAEMSRTAFQRKAVTAKSAAEALEEAITFFQARGYRAGKTGRPNQIYVMGGREGKLPRVNAEILAQANVGKSKTTMLTISGFGEELSRHLKDYLDLLRQQRRSGGTSPDQVRDT